MTEPEIEAWVELLGPTRTDRLVVLNDLLRHAAEDKMTAEDRSICRAAQAQLVAEVRARLVGRLRTA